MLFRFKLLTRRIQKTISVVSLGISQSNEKMELGTEFNLPRQQLIPFGLNSMCGIACTYVGYQTIRLMPFTCGFLYSTGHILPAAGLTIVQGGFGIILFIGAKIFLLNAYEICYTKK